MSKARAIVFDLFEILLHDIKFDSLKCKERSIVE